MENNLKKEFTKRDVQRMRNLITGKTGDKTQIQTGWEKHDQLHKEGDTWEDSGKKWIIKNGIRQTVTKLDNLKRLVMLPLSCPNCRNVMKVDDYNKKMWAIHEKCFDCVIKMESEIKRTGKWDEYSANILNSNKNAELDDLALMLDEWVDDKDTFVSESGELEKWDGGDRNELHKRIKKRIAELRGLDIYKK